VAFGGLTAAIVFLLVTLTPGARSASATASPVLLAFVIALVAYFAILEGAAAIGFATAARRRAGASRTRLWIAAVATALFALALVVLLGRGLVTTPETDAYAAADLIGRFAALLSALGYLVAFAPPRGLRRLSQQSIVYDFIRDLNLLPNGSPVEHIWALLEKAAAGSTTASRVAVVTSGSTPGPGPNLRRLTVPFQSLRWPAGHLELDLPCNALFLDDDLELIDLLVDRAVRAAEREGFLEERERLIAELSAASAAKSDFLAAMSHELRTPLNAIIGFSELLSEDGAEATQPATVKTYAGHVHDSGLHLLELVNDVLDLARVEAGRLDLKPINIELDALVRHTVASLQPLADQKRHTVTLQLAPVTIEADPARVRQIVLNLLSNAIKFTDPEVRFASRSRPTTEVRLASSSATPAAGSPRAISSASSKPSTRARGPATCHGRRAPGSGLP
jgi:signal transduction histidine kinase